MKRLLLPLLAALALPGSSNLLQELGSQDFLKMGKIG